MKSTLTIALLPLLLATSAAGEDLTAAKKVTAQMIVDALRTRDGGLHEGAEINQARGYLRGAKDSANVDWCPPAWLPNLEVDGEIVGFLADLPPAARQGDAAPQVAAALRAKFPCPRKKER